MFEIQDTNNKKGKNNKNNLIRNITSKISSKSNNNNKNNIHNTSKIITPIIKPNYNKTQKRRNVGFL